MEHEANGMFPLTGKEILVVEDDTGKTAIALWIHYQGPRSAYPLIEINCSTLTQELAESELFGHERGAFTDAKERRIGLFEAAHQGTLFLDEISSLSPAFNPRF
jgi:transcriptional regulator with GAF, ATPase, and Fis domain